ncbi:transposase [Mesorhizobium sp. M0590]|uniref:transposase n=1 Tax=Mesorhizobium sp. M0590 TaxID=2956966 RepID=UPI00333AA811
MGKPLPLELRRRVVAFVDEGYGHREAARHFRVSPRFVNNLIKLRRQTGSLEARRQGHVGGGKLERRAEFVRLRSAETGELTLDELCVELEGRGVGLGVSVHRSNVGRLLNRLGLSHKKKLYWPASSSGPTCARRVNCGSGGESAFQQGFGAADLHR